MLTPSGGGLQTFDNQEFFPLDGRGWDDEYVADDGMLHNFSFTFELHTTFGYTGGETFTFIGDDDVFVFIDSKLVVDLGGVHSAETKSIQLDTLTTDDAAQSPVPLTVGTTYPLDIFYNERHTVSSHFRMDTSIGFNNCAPIIVRSSPGQRWVSSDLISQGHREDGSPEQDEISQISQSPCDISSRVALERHRQVEGHHLVVGIRDGPVDAPAVREARLDHHVGRDGKEARRPPAALRLSRCVESFCTATGSLK